jgi:two-component system, NarL family, nitrate/nitrite response regulator NarL
VARGNGRIRLLIADDHPLFREGLIEAIQERPELDLVDNATDGREALEAIKRLEPDVALLDVRMPELDGLEILRSVESGGLATDVVLLSAYVDGEFAYSAVASGARGYLSKTEDSGSICDAVVTVAEGGTVFAPEIQAGLAGAIRVRESTEQRSALTEREREVLSLVARGLTTPDIAAAIHLSPATVKTHLQRVYQKLGVPERAAAVAEALRRGLLD